MEHFLSTNEVAARLGVDRSTVLRYLRTGKLAGSRIGRVYRIRESSVVAFVRATNATAREKRGALVTAIVNQRAGAGKTATAHNLTLSLQRLGQRVLAIDLDPQASLSVSLGVAPTTLTTSVYRALMEESLDPRPVIRQTSSGVDGLPATIDLAVAEVELVNMMQRELVLRDLLHKLRPRYDHIVIDCPSSLGLLTINALAAADQVLIPTPCDELTPVASARYQLIAVNEGVSITRFRPGRAPLRRGGAAWRDADRRGGAGRAGRPRSRP